MKATVKAILLLLVATAATAKAQDVERPVLSAYTLEAGSAHIADTYLTPLKYYGQNYALGYERMQAMRFSPDRWVMRLRGRLSLERVKSPARNSLMWGLGLDLGWSMMHRWRPAQQWTVMAGGYTSADAGVLYLSRNSNNPASAKGAWTVGVSAAAVYNGRIGRIPFCARYQAELPLTGIFFTPQYGELYYEIWLGNHSGLVHGAWPGNYFGLDNLATVDLRFGRTILRLGYRCDILSSKANDIVSRSVTHTAVVGIASEWLSLGPSDSRKAEQARITSSLY